MDKDQTTHFGFEKINWQEKSKKVEAVFSAVANQYDLMNDVMSLGMHRLWKSQFIQQVSVRSDQSILDLAGGTGDIAIQLCRKLKGTGQVILSDINLDMLQNGKEKISNQYYFKNLSYLQVDAQAIPFPDNTFDRITMSFGLRNVTDKLQALREMQRVLKPGGRCFILEFSKPTTTLLEKCYDFYSFKLIPNMGACIANDRKSYEYLVESIRMHPDQNSLKEMMLTAQFDAASYTNLSGGIVAIHQGVKY